MRTKHILSILILTILIFASSKNFAQQFTFSLDPNIKATSGHLGFKAKNFVFFLGAENQKFDVYNIETAPNLRTEYISEEEVFILFFGMKGFVLETNKMKFYIKTSAGLTHFRSRINPKDVGLEFHEREHISNINMNDFGLFQIKFGIGAEYFISENFSFGGDMGGRTFIGDTEANLDEYLDGNSYREIDIYMKEYYASLYFNFYFK